MKALSFRSTAAWRPPASHDVVLLNSDTEVPLGWLRRLTAQAYAHPRIATVSPLSNNATICSYPGNAGGLIPFEHTLDEIDQACRTVNAGRWVDAPTTVGFCMYIRRKALREVGAFDAERFNVGYGEENDFCLRATALGWRHGSPAILSSITRDQSVSATAPRNCASAP